MPQLTPSTRNRLCEYFLYLSKLESEIEIIRNLLCEFNNFHPFFLFKYIDGITSDSKGQITSQDLLLFLEENGFIHNVQECYQYIDLYDEESKGFLLYSQFLRIILPQANTALRQKIALSNVERPQFDEKIQYTLAKLINYEIKGMEKASFFLQKLQDCSDFSPTTCFESLDHQMKKKLNINNLKELFSQSSIKIFPQELQSLFKRFDLLNDGYIDLNEFLKVMKQRIFNPNEQKTPIKEKSYLNNFKDSQQKKDSSKLKQRTQNTPMKHLNSILKQTGSPKFEINNQRSVSFVNSSKTNRTMTLNQSSIWKTPVQNRKYIDQKTELRAQLSLFKVQNSRQVNSTIKKVRSKKSNSKLDETNKKTITPPIHPPIFIQNILLKMIEQEKDIEKIKLNLYEFPEFSLQSLFRFLDKQKLGFLVAEDLTPYLSKQNLQLIIKKINPDGRILFKQFYELITPNSLFLQELDTRQTEKSKNFVLTGKIKQLFMILLEKIYLRQIYIDKIIQEIKNNQQYDLKFLFMILDEDSGDNEISLKDLDSFFYRQCIQPDLEDLELLFNRLDTDKDGKISFLDFINIFTN